jgi:hypothetical protein
LYIKHRASWLPKIPSAGQMQEFSWFQTLNMGVGKAFGFVSRALFLCFPNQSEIGYVSCTVLSTYLLVIY